MNTTLSRYEYSQNQQSSNCLFAPLSFSAPHIHFENKVFLEIDRLGQLPQTPITRGGCRYSITEELRFLGSGVEEYPVARMVKNEKLP